MRNRLFGFFPREEALGQRRHHDSGHGAPEPERRHGREGRGGPDSEGRRERGGRDRRRWLDRHGLHSGRKLSATDLEAVLLALLNEHPAHGYELIKSLADRSHGLYVPSPGMIYPALTYLEEIGYATVELDANKKRYSLTDAGRASYEQNRDLANRILADLDRIGSQMAEAREAVEGRMASDGDDGGCSDVLDSARLALGRAQYKDEPYTPHEARRVADILIRAAAKIRRVLESSEDAS